MIFAVIVIIYKYRKNIAAERKARDSQKIGTSEKPATDELDKQFAKWDAAEKKKDGKI